MAAILRQDGTGWEASDGHELCETCEGRGTLTCGECDGNGSRTHECDRGYEHEEDCDACDQGEVECYDCDGQGEIIDDDIEMDPTL